MAKVIREERVVDEPRDQAVVDNRDERPRNNTGLMVVGIIVLLIILFLLFSGGGNTPAPSVPTPTAPTAN